MPSWWHSLRVFVIQRLPHSHVILGRYLKLAWPYTSRTCGALSNWIRKHASPHSRVAITGACCQVNQAMPFYSKE